MPHTYRAALLFPVLSLMACGTAPTPQTQTAALQDASAQPASARLSAQATSSACEGGGFRLVSGGVSVQGNRGADLNVPAGARVQVLGKYVEFEVAGDTLSVLNYTMTGAANPQDITGGQRTVVFASKAADFGGRKLSGTLKASLSGEGLLLERRGSGIKMKIQAKDCAQVAKLVSQSETVSVWSVQSGGRMGGVLGEDAVEIGAGPTQCVQSCQAQNQIRGTLPVTDPAYSNN